MEQFETVKAARLKLDYSLYPRHELNQQHVADLRAALASGALLPPVIADRKSRRVVDGFHRTRAVLRDPTAEIAVIWREYQTDQEMFLEAVKLNAAHGARLTHFDLAHCIVLSKEFKLQPAQLAEALHLTVDRLQRIELNRTATDASGKLVPIKRIAAHLAGGRMTAAQTRANTKALGVRQQFLIQQLTNLIEGGLIDSADKELLVSLRKLADLIERYLAPARRKAS